MKPDAKRFSSFSLPQIIMTLLLLILIFFLSRQAAAIKADSVSGSAAARTQSNSASKPVVVLDSGHGGFDPDRKSVV